MSQTDRFTIDQFSPELRARMAPFAEEWIRERLRTDPADRALVEDGMRRCYELAGLRWHGNVVWVRSPLAVSLAGPIACYLLSDRGDAVYVAVGDAVYGAVGDAVDVAVYDTVDDAVDVAVHLAVRDAVYDAVRVAVHDAVHGVVGGAVHGAVHGAVGGAVDDAVDDAVHDAVHDAVRSSWHRRLDPWWSWEARNNFCIQHLKVAQHKAQHAAAYRDAQSAGWWWPHSDFVIVCDRPTVIAREQIGAPGWGSHQLHNDSGPAIRWGDEWALWFWHGLRVPQWVVESPTVEQIQAEANTEIRRAAIESFGWDRYLDALGITPVDECDDPGNPGHRLQLFDLPAEHQVYGEPVRLVVMDNASRDRDGSRRRYAETVPIDVPDAVAAQAWAFDVPVETYRMLERAT